MPGPRKRHDISREDFAEIQNWDKERFTSSLYKVHVQLLRELADEIGLPVSTLLTQAIDKFLTDTGRIESPKVPQIDIKTYLQGDDNNA